MTRGWPDEPSSAVAERIDLPIGPVSCAIEGPKGAPTIVLIHGVPGTVADFRWLTPCIADDLRVVRLDMPGFGGTPLSSAQGTGMVERANFIAAVLRGLDIQSAAVVGHSMGGAAAAAVAVHHPSLVSHVGLLATPGLTPHRKFVRTYPGPVSRAMRWPVLGNAVRAIVRRGFEREGFPSKMGGASIQTVMDYAAGLDFPAHKRRVLSLRQPTLVGYCENDHLVDKELFAELASVCPEGPRLVFPRGGHNLQKTHAMAIGRALVDWLSA